MSDTLAVITPSTAGAVEPPTMSWRAIIAGAVAALALSLVLVTVGSAVGFSSISPWPGEGVSATTFKIGAGLWLVVTAMLASTVGGYVAGRLRGRWPGLYGYEVQFRDTAHGFLAWALALVIGAAALGGAATVLAGGAASGAAAGGTAAAAGAPSDYYADMLLRPAPGGQAQRDAGTAEAAGREVRRIFLHNLSGGENAFAAGDRAYMAQLVAARTGANQAEAERRVGEVITQARAAADEARSAAAALSIWLAISMFAGAFSASLAAIEGGQLRDRRWKGIIGTRAYGEARIIES
jgi:hypothetical protein